MKKLFKSKGFTLIELMIVVAIIGILAAIAIPNFIRYQLKSKTTEAKTVMGGIKTSQEAFRAEIDNYANITSLQPPVLPGTVKTGWGIENCDALCDRTTTQASCLTFDCIGYSPSGNVYYRYAAPHRPATTSQTAEFGAGAQADLDGDGVNLGQFAYRSSNEVGGDTGFVADGLTTCVPEILGGQVQDCAPGFY